MTRLTPHFTLEEFLASDAAVRLGDANMPTADHRANLGDLARGLEKVRELLDGRAIVVTSGYRNPRVNHAVGGVATSAHARGWAADFRVAGMTPLQAGLRLAASTLLFDQLIHEVDRDILHLSFEPRGRRDVLTQHGAAGTPFEKGLTA